MEGERQYIHKPQTMQAVIGVIFENSAHCGNNEKGEQLLLDTVSRGILSEETHSSIFTGL